MLVVRIELHSAITGNVTELGRLLIANTGDHPDHPHRGSYTARVGRKGASDNRRIWEKPQRQAAVEDYPRQAYSVWELVRRSLNALYDPTTLRGVAAAIVCGPRLDPDAEGGP